MEGSAMALTNDKVRALADYACIALSDDELMDMTAYLSDAVDMLEPILRYADADVEPTYYPAGNHVNVMRDDTPEPVRGLAIDDALANAGSSRDRQFRVPSILG